MKTPIIIIRLIFVVLAFAFLQQFIIPLGVYTVAQIFPGELIGLTNRDRAFLRLSRLRIDPLLMEAAEMKARHMAENGYFSHGSPDGESPWYWFDLVGYPYSYAGENLALNFEDSKDVEQAWMESALHRENITSQDFSDIGLGLATGTYYGRPDTYVVQRFGKK